MTGTAAGVLAVAAGQIGYRESTPHGRQKYSDAMDMPYTEWCAIFMSWCLRQSSCPDAYAATRVTLFNNHYAALGRTNRTPSPGALVCYDWGMNGLFDHIGVVEKVLPDGRIQTIEGNTGPNENHTGVYRMIRTQGNVRSYCHPAYTGTPAGSGAKYKPGIDLNTPYLGPKGEWLSRPPVLAFRSPVPIRSIDSKGKLHHLTWDARVTPSNLLPTLRVGAGRRDYLASLLVTFARDLFDNPTPANMPPWKLASAGGKRYSWGAHFGIQPGGRHDPKGVFNTAMASCVTQWAEAHGIAAADPSRTRGELTPAVWASLRGQVKA